MLLQSNIALFLAFAFVLGLNAKDYELSFEGGSISANAEQTILEGPVCLTFGQWKITASRESRPLLGGEIKKIDNSYKAETEITRFVFLGQCQLSKNGKEENEQLILEAPTLILDLKTNTVTALGHVVRHHTQGTETHRHFILGLEEEQPNPE